MPLVPDKKVEKIQFFENHLSIWATNAVAIGTSAGAVTDLTTKTNAARAAYDAQQLALDAAKTKTLAYHNAVAAMGTAGASIIKQIRAKAEISGSGIYELASIPAPALPSPVGPPGQPYQFNVLLLQNGTLELAWKCSNPPGCNNVIYQVYRKIELTGAYEYIGGTGERKFVDLSVPGGVPSIMYQIQATRSTAIGVVGEFIVNFGVTSGGTITATVASATKPAKVAA